MTRSKIVALVTVSTALSLVAIASGESSSGPGKDDPAAHEPPTAAFSLTPAFVVAGETVELDASKSTTGDGLAPSYTWDLDGDGVFETDPSDDPKATQSYESAGDVTVSLRVSDGEGRVAEHGERLTVTPAPAPEVEEPPAAEGGSEGKSEQEPPAEAPTPTDAEPAADAESSADAEPTADAAPKEAAPEEAASAEGDEPATSPGDVALPAPTVERAVIARAQREARASAKSDDAERKGVRRLVTARAAATKTVAIKDFEFAPKTIEISVGDTVEWTNDGPTAHSATADDDSFDTGILDKGGSGSNTFDEAGTFAYHCEPHPFMKATVVVSGAGGGGGGAGAAESDTGASASGADDLPDTGRDLGGSIVFGTLLLGLGLGLFALTSRDPSA